MQKMCPACETPKDINEFNSQGKYCKPCHAKNGKRWRLHNRRANKESQDKWRKNQSIDPNHEKTAQLGMPFGTACNRLRVQVMFVLTQKCGLDICYKCGEKIEQPEELSIEHKHPWLHVS